MTMTWLKEIPTITLLNKKASELIPNLTIELVNAYVEELKTRISAPLVNPLEDFPKGILFDKAMKELKENKIAGEVEILTNKDLPKKTANILINICNTTEHLLRIYDEVGQDHKLSHALIILLQKNLPKEISIEMLQSSSTKEYKRRILVFVPSKYFEKVKTEMQVHSSKIIKELKNVPAGEEFTVRRFLEETTIEVLFVEEK